jgi:hypothetical protein
LQVAGRAEETDGPARTVGGKHAGGSSLSSQPADFAMT